MHTAETIQSLAQRLFEAAAAGGGAPGADMGAGAQAGGAKPADDNVVDAEVKEVKKG